MSLLYRPRPIDIWAAQYSGDKAPLVISDYSGAEVLAPRIHTLDLIVIRPYDSQGRATPLLRQATWQYVINMPTHGRSVTCFDRLGIEGLWGELRPGNVNGFMGATLKGHEPCFLYWLVEGVPQPGWSRDYPAVVRDIFEDRMAEKVRIWEHLDLHWEQNGQERVAMLADHHLGQES